MNEGPIFDRRNRPAKWRFLGLPVVGGGEAGALVRDEAYSALPDQVPIEPDALSGLNASGGFADPPSEYIVPIRGPKSLTRLRALRFVPAGKSR